MKLNRAELNMLQIAVRHYAQHLIDTGEVNSPQGAHLGFAYAHLKGYEQALDNLEDYPVGSKAHTAAKVATS